MNSANTTGTAVQSVSTVSQRIPWAGSCAAPRIFEADSLILHPGLDMLCPEEIPLSLARRVVWHHIDA